MLMRDGHFDYGNGYHGRVYLNPHQLFRHPSTIWRLAQDLIDVLPARFSSATEVVAGPATGGALLAHTIAGLLDGRRALTHPPAASRRSRRRGTAASRCAAFYARADARPARAARRRRAQHRARRSQRCAELVARRRRHRDRDRRDLRSPGGVVDAGVPNFALAEYKAPENYPRPATARCAQAGVARSRAFCRCASTAVASLETARSKRRRSTRSTATFNRDDSATDPVAHRPPRTARPADREVAGFCAAALAFGRVASVLQLGRGAARVHGPAAGARSSARFDPAARRRRACGRWCIAGRAATTSWRCCWILRQMLRAVRFDRGVLPAGEIRRRAGRGARRSTRFSTRALALDLRRAYGRRVPRAAGRRAISFRGRRRAAPASG